MVHHLLPGIVQAQHLPGHGQGVPADGIHDQEFFLNTKSTHMLSVTDIRDRSDHESVLARGDACHDGWEASTGLHGVPVIQQTQPPAPAQAEGIQMPQPRRGIRKAQPRKRTVKA